MDSLQYEKEYSVHLYETGPDGKLNMHSLFNYMQDIASDHAIKLGFGRDALLKDKRFWVLSRMYAVIETWPLWDDKIIVKTWPNGTDNLFALRNYELYFPGGKHIAYGTSSWLILDLATRRVQRPDPVLSTYNANLLTQSSPIRYAGKLPAFDNISNASEFKVKISDLDVNLHTNNARYLNWAYDTYKLDFVLGHVPQSVEINYLAESVFNEDISVTISREDGPGRAYNHSVFRTNDKKELCRIRIEWKEDNMKKVN